MTLAGAIRWLRAASFGNAAVLALLVFSVLVHLIVTGDPVSFRNALAFNPGAMAEAGWTPARVPEGFKLEAHPAHPLLASHAERLRREAGGDDVGTAFAIAAHLLRKADQGGPIRGSLLDTYKAIVEEGKGYCADFVDVFVALADAAGVPARMWGFSFHGFGRGHIFVEIFDRRRGKWVMLDVFNNAYPRAIGTGELLSAIEFREALIGGSSGIEFRRIAADARKGFAIEGKAFEYYRRGLGQWYLFWGNNVISRDADPLVGAARALARDLEGPAAMLVGLYPEIRVLATSDNQDEVAQLRRLRLLLLLTLWAGVALVVLTALHLALGRVRIAGRARRAGLSNGT